MKIMNRFKPLATGCVLCSTLVCLSTPAHSADAANEDAREARIAHLEAKLARMEQQQQQQWLTERRKEEIKGLVHEVLSDAETRASLLESGMNAGHDGKRFYLRSADGGFLLNIAGQIQLRHVMNFRNEDDSTANAYDNQETGFELRRTKIEFAGHIADPRLKYALQIAINNGDNSAYADKIIIGYQITDSLYLWGGEDKGPFLREEMTSSKQQLAVERSYVNEIFTIDKVQGVGLTWHDKHVLNGSIKVHLMLNDGLKSGDGGSSVSPFTQRDDFGAQLTDRSTGKGFSSDGTDIAVTGRMEVRLMGDWGQMKDFTSWPGEDQAAFIGAAIHYERGEAGDTFANNNFLSWTIDASWEYNGWNVYGAVMGTHTDNQNTFGGTTADFNLLGFVIQGGYNIPVGEDSLEPFARYEYIDFDDAMPAGGLPGDELDDLGILTFGVNYYFNKHNAKLTFDVVYAMDRVPVGSSGLGILADGSDEDDQIVVRTQFQLLF